MALTENKEKKPVVRDTKPAASGRTPGARGGTRATIQDDDYEGGLFSMAGIRHGMLHSTVTKVVMGLLIFIFAIAGVLLSTNNNVPGIPGGPSGSGSDPVASVDGQSVSLNQFHSALQNQLNMMQMYGQAPEPTNLLGQEQSVLQSLVEGAATYSLAQKAGISASDADIDKKINELIDEQVKSQKDADEGAFRRQVESRYAGGETEMREELRKSFDRDAVARSLVLEKFEKSIKDANKVTEDDYKRSVTRLTLRQIVIQPAAPTPAEKDFAAALEKNGKAAMEKAEKIVADLKGKTGPALTQAFIETAKKESSDTATKDKGGQLGAKLPSELQFSPEVKKGLINSTGSVVGPLQDAFTKNALVFLVENRKLELPKDFAKNKDKLVKEYETQVDNEAWAAKQDEIRKSAKPEIHAPALLAYRLQTADIATAADGDKDTLRNQALDKYKEALASALPMEQAAINYQMSQLYRDLKQPAKAIESLEAALQQDNRAPQVRLELARLFGEQKRKQDALNQLKEISKSLDASPSRPTMFGNPDDQIRQQVAAEYVTLGEPKLAEEERKKIKPAAPMGGMGGPGSPFRITPGG